MNPIDGQMQLGKVQAEQLRQAQLLNKGQAAGKAASPVPGGRDPAEIRKVAEEFESLFLGIVLKSMRDTVQKSGLIDGGNAEDIYRSMLDEEYSKMMAAQRHTGLADSIEASMLGMQPKGETLQATPGAVQGPQPVQPAAPAKPAISAGLAAYAPQALQQGLREAAKRATMEVGAGPASPAPGIPGTQGGTPLPSPSAGFRPKAI